ncbi:aldo/keto reductase [Kribbella antibiotica]|uniref:Aldo/keto reductase n=1 Tax=Kribbella antibiotica TaxID=190195 RepID=A0A4V2YLP4_9ACTN|nr:aldo/keto reductase [Kribbella antibiotica]TDD46927.1 aldo/keto reductase [Kribbella antibiotica]
MTTLDSYLTVPGSGLRISPATLGTMTFGEDHGWGASVADSERMLDEYVDAGGNSLDTVNIYTNGHSEVIIGDWLTAHPELRDRLVLGSKFFVNLHPGDPNGGGAGRKAILHQVEDSLRRLRTDYLDIYWLHNFDPATPREETLRALDDLVRAGKIRYVGFSDVPAWATTEAIMLARQHSWAPVVAIQAEYSLLERTAEGELLPMARALGAGVFPWSPLKGGWLSGKFRTGATEAADTIRSRDNRPPASAYPVLDAVHAVAAELGTTPVEVALAWVRGTPGVTSTILGARRPEQLSANLRSLTVDLPPELRARLDDVSAPALNFPAANNSLLAPMLQFAGATVDGVAHSVYPALVGAERY